METSISEMKCPVCGEAFRLIRPDAEGLPEGWLFDVVHDHSPSTQDAGVWTGIVYQHLPRQRYPKDLKAILEERKTNRARAIAQRKAGGKGPGYETCPLHPRGCEAFKHEGELI